MAVRLWVLFESSEMKYSASYLFFYNNLEIGHLGKKVVLSLIFGGKSDKKVFSSLGKT